jgi:hypothetical protein
VAKGPEDVASVTKECSYRMPEGQGEYMLCYGRLAIVSDVDDGGFALNVDNELRGSAVL